MAPYLQAFAEWATTLEFDDVPDDVVERTKQQIASTLGAAYGTLNGDGERFVDALSDGEPPASVPEPADASHAVVGEGNWSERATTAYVRNAAASMYYDYDDYCFMGHTGHSAVFASLAACEAVDGDGTDFLRGVVIATELEGRLGASVVVGPLNGQLWSFIHQAGAAAVWAVLGGGSADEVLDAVRIALAVPPHPLAAGLVGGDSKALIAAAPGATGVRAGRLALAGARGSPAAFDGPDGFLETFATLPIPEMLTGFGESWVSRSLAFKPRPGCAYQQAPVEAVESLLADRSIEPDEVCEVTVAASLPTVAVEALSRRHRGTELQPVGVPFSVEYGIAALLSSGYDTTTLSRTALEANRASLDDLAGRVRVEHDWERTIDLVDGISAGIDFGSLIAERGIASTLVGLVGVGRSRSELSVLDESLRLIRSGNALDVIDALRSPLDWDAFDLSNASFADLEFRFGCSVSIRTDTGVHELAVPAHRGARRGSGQDRGTVAYEKLEREVGGRRDGPSPAAAIRSLEDGDFRKFRELL